MAKYNVGVGDAFPADEPDRSVERDRPDERERDRTPSEREARRRDCDDSGWSRRRHRTSIFWRIAVLLLLIWGALAIFNGHGPRGLLIAAGIMVAIGIFQWMFSSGDRDRERYEERRRMRRRWGER